MDGSTADIGRSRDARAHGIAGRLWRMPVAAAAIATLAASAACSPSPSSTVDDAGTARLHVYDLQTPGDLRSLFRPVDNGAPLLTTHRGGAREGFPENAIETFEHTLRHTWSSMEVDPRYTKDGVIVLFHDQTLDRTSTGTGDILDYTYAELRQLRLRDPDGRVTDFSMPTLDAALAWAKGKTVLFLDTKDVDVLERARAIQRHDAHAWAVVMAYSFEDARRVYDFDPDILMQVFLPDTAAIARFDDTGIPWDQVVGFVTHTTPREPGIFAAIAARDTMGILGTSRTMDRAYLDGEIDREQLLARYRAAIAAGAHVVEADLGIEAGEALEPLRAAASATARFFTRTDAPVR